MELHVALIRAIGPVTHAKMRMASLRDACEDLGLEDVVTVGNTGNIVFRSTIGDGGDRAHRLALGRCHLQHDAARGFGVAADLQPPLVLHAIGGDGRGTRRLVAIAQSRGISATCWTRTTCRWRCRRGRC